MAATHIIATYSGQLYTEFVKERIFDPLGMTSTTFSVDEAIRSGKFTQMWFISGRRIPYWFSEDIMQLNAGPGGVISNVVDMVCWAMSCIGPTTDVGLLDQVAANATEWRCQSCHQRGSHTR